MRSQGHCVALQFATKRVARLMFWPLVTLTVTIPTTWPRRLSSGLPLLPWETGAVDLNDLPDGGTSRGPRRCRRSPSLPVAAGFPIRKTFSPSSGKDDEDEDARAIQRQFYTEQREVASSSTATAPVTG